MRFGLPRFEPPTFGCWLHGLMSMKPLKLIGSLNMNLYRWVIAETDRPTDRLEETQTSHPRYTDRLLRNNVTTYGSLSCDRWTDRTPQPTFSSPHWFYQYVSKPGGQKDKHLDRQTNWQTEKQWCVRNEKRNVRIHMRNVRIHMRNVQIHMRNVRIHLRNVRIHMRNVRTQLKQVSFKNEGGDRVQNQKCYVEEHLKHPLTDVLAYIYVSISLLM